MNIALIAGTRPELIKMLPIHRALSAQGAHVTPRLICTGQHRELAADILPLFNVTPEVDLAVMQPGQSLPQLLARLTRALSDFLAATPPNMLLVQGDTSSAMVAAMLGFNAGIAVAHIEAGLRTGNLASPFPEEFNRRVISLAARWHFVPTRTAADHLAREGITENVHVVGNTVIDAAQYIAGRESAAVQALRAQFPFIDTLEKNLVLVTAHRRENFGVGMQNIAAAIRMLATQYPALQFILPVHPNPQVKSVLEAALNAQANIHLTAPLPYDALLYLLQHARLVLTDSGGIQEEAPSFNVPVLVLREETERPEGVAAGCSMLVGTDVKKITTQFAELIRDAALYTFMANAPNPYGDGKSAERIVDILLSSP